MNPLSYLWNLIKTKREPLPPWPPGCGVDGVWRTTDEDVNQEACIEHDKPYDEGGFSSYEESAKNDESFAEATKETAKKEAGEAQEALRIAVRESWEAVRAKVESVIYPPIVRLWGAISYFTGRSKKK